MAVCPTAAAIVISISLEFATSVISCRIPHTFGKDATLINHLLSATVPQVESASGSLDGDGAGAAEQAEVSKPIVAIPTANNFDNRFIVERSSKQVVN